jgi:hypothetical protein
MIAGTQATAGLPATACERDDSNSRDGSDRRTLETAWRDTNNRRYYRDANCGKNTCNRRVKQLQYSQQDYTTTFSRDRDAIE